MNPEQVYCYTFLKTIEVYTDFPRASVNIIIENLKTKLGLPKPKLAPYHLRMADQSMTRPLGIIKILKIHIHGTPYVATFIVLQNNVVDSRYSMLLGRLWLKDA